MKDRSKDPLHHEQMLLPWSRFPLLMSGSLQYVHITINTICWVHRKIKTFPFSNPVTSKSSFWNCTKGSYYITIMINITQYWTLVYTVRKDTFLKTHLCDMEGNVLFNDTLNSFYLRFYGITHMVKDHSDSERKPATATWATLSD